MSSIRRFAGLFLAFSFIVWLPAASLTTVKAVTYGDPVTDRSLFPEVVSIFSWDSSTGEYSPICTGTLISQIEVLTAAHCIRNQENLLVNVGALTNDDWNPIGVVGSWYSSRYSQRRFANDIGLIRLVREAGSPRVAELTRSFKPNRKTRYLLVGYGLDQNGDSLGLRFASLVPQDKAALRYFGSSFNPKTTLGAGRYFKTERVYAGGCNGDSGGPLFSLGSKGKLTVVGIVSYGAVECDERAPTVFSRVSYYNSMISSGRRTLEQLTASPLAPLSVSTVRSGGYFSFDYLVNATTAEGFFIRSLCIKINGVPATTSQVNGDISRIPYSSENGCFYNNFMYDLNGGTIKFASSQKGANVELTVMDELRRTAISTFVVG